VEKKSIKKGGDVQKGASIGTVTSLNFQKNRGSNTSNIQNGKRPSAKPNLTGLNFVRKKATHLLGRSSTYTPRLAGKGGKKRQLLKNAGGK